MIAVILAVSLFGRLCDVSLAQVPNYAAPGQVHEEQSDSLPQTLHNAVNIGVVFTFKTPDPPRH